MLLQCSLHGNGSRIRSLRGHQSYHCDFTPDSVLAEIDLLMLLQSYYVTRSGARILGPRTRAGNRLRLPVSGFRRLRRGSVRGTLPGCAPQERCGYSTSACMSGGVLPPPVCMFPSYSSARHIATPPKALVASGAIARMAFAILTQVLQPGDRGFYDFRPLRKVGLDGGYFFLGGTTASLNAFARRNFTTVLAGILMASRV